MLAGNKAITVNQRARKLTASWNRIYLMYLSNKIIVPKFELRLLKGNKGNFQNPQLNNNTITIIIARRYVLSRREIFAVLHYYT